MALPTPRRWQSIRPPIPEPDKVYKLPLDSFLFPFAAILTSGQQAQLRQEFRAYMQQGSIPVTAANQLIDRLAEWSLPDLDRIHARQRIGYEVVRFAPHSSIITRILAAPLRLMEPVRLLQYIPKVFGSVFNYGTVTTWETAPRHWYIEIGDQPIYMDYFQGNFQAAGTELLKVPSWRVVGAVQGQGHYLFTVTW